MLCAPGLLFFCATQALAVGAVPIVVDDGVFDMRVYDGSDVWLIKSAVRANAQRTHAHTHTPSHTHTHTH